MSTETDENGLSILSLATLQGISAQDNTDIILVDCFIPNTVCYSGDEEMVLWILENFPRVAEVPNASGNLAVHFAAAQGKCPDNNKVAFFHDRLSFIVMIAHLQIMKYRELLPHSILPEVNTWSYTSRGRHHILNWQLKQS